MVRAIVAVSRVSSPTAPNNYSAWWPGGSSVPWPLGATAVDRHRLLLQDVRRHFMQTHDTRNTDQTELLINGDTVDEPNDEPRRRR